MTSVEQQLETREEPRSWGSPYDLDAVHRQAALIAEVVRRVKPQVEQVITPEVAESTTKVFITGCGDSHYAGLSARLFFDRYSGVQTEPLESLEFSRYVSEFIPKGSLTLGISNSGAVSRTIETLLRSRKHGGRTVAITGSEGSALAKAADATLLQTVPDMVREENSPFSAGVPYGAGSLGLGNYVASLTTLYLAALRLGELRGKLTAEIRDGLQQELIRVSDTLEATALANAPIARQLADRFWNLDTFFILGAGPNYGTAQFAAAKLFEQPHLKGIPQELEEWAHEQYFLTRPLTTPIFILAPQGRAHDRALEQMRGARDMGATVIGLAAEGDRDVAAAADVVMPIVGEVSEEYSPLAYIVPGMLFATAMHQLTGRPAFTSEYTEDKMMQVNFRQIFHSQIVED